MAAKHYCDRCGAECKSGSFLVNTLGHQTPKKIAYMHLRIGIEKRVDLCRECEMDFTEWWNIGGSK